MGKLKIDDRMRLDWLQWFLYEQGNDFDGDWLRDEDKPLREVIDECIFDGRFGPWKPL